MALEDINTNILEIYPKDTASDPNQTLKSAGEFIEMGIDIVVGPIFHKSLLYLDELENITFLSLTNKIVDLPKNVISSGINASSQLNTIKKFIKSNDLKKTIFLMPKQNYEEEVKKAIKNSNIKLYKTHL